MWGAGDLGRYHVLRVADRHVPAEGLLPKEEVWMHSAVQIATSTSINRMAGLFFHKIHDEEALLAKVEQKVNMNKHLSGVISTPLGSTKLIVTNYIVLPQVSDTKGLA